MVKSLQNFDDFLTESLSEDREFASEFLKSNLNDYFKSKDQEELLITLRYLAKSKGVSEMVKKTGLSRNVFYKSLDLKGNPRLDTLMTILSSLDLRLQIIPAAAQ